jgi:alginate O-acetyltransferase complex protein AlgI
MALFRLVAYAHDRRSRGVPRRPLREFLAAMFFFPTFPYGPVETTEAFAAGRPAGGIAPPSFAALGAQLRVAGRSAARLVWGALKLQGATLALGTITPDVYATGGEAVGHLRLWAWTAELSLFFYLTVSGLNDVAIALGAMAGSTVTENFRAPWAATGPGDFWRRWNVALGRWLRDYVYIPLGGNRRRAPLNVLVVFLVSALWHAWGTLKLFGPTAYPPKAWGGFLLWGLVGAAGVMIAHRWPARDGAATPRSALRALWGRAWRFAATFAVVSVGWIAFFLPPWEELGDVGRILLRLLFVPGQGAS